MSTLNWSLLSIVRSFDEIKVLTKSNGVYQSRISNLKSSTKYSFKCNEYHKYPLCNYDIKATVSGNNPNSITVMFRNPHKHEYRNGTPHLPSPIRHSVSKYPHIGLSEAQISFNTST